MVPTSITMCVQKQGRIKYLILTLFPPLILMCFLQFLMQCNVLPDSSVWRLIYTCLALLTLGYLAYNMVFRKNHQIDIEDKTITETDFRGKQSCCISVSQISSVRRNFLNELILLDKDGKQLLCVESNMTNFDQFKDWLSNHDIN